MLYCYTIISTYYTLPFTRYYRSKCVLRSQSSLTNAFNKMYFLTKYKFLFSITIIIIFCQRMFNVLWWYANVLDLIDFPYSFKGLANRLLRSTIVSNILDPIGFEVFLAHSSQFKCTLLWIMDRKTKVVSEKRISNCLVQVPILLLACDWWNTLTMHFQRSTNVLQYVRFIRETYT